LFFSLHRTFSEMERSTTNPQTVYHLMRDIEDIYEKIARSVNIRRKIRDSVDHYLKNIE
jgi:hypothetical protein